MAFLVTILGSRNKTKWSVFVISTSQGYLPYKFRLRNVDSWVFRKFHCSINFMHFLLPIYGKFTRAKMLVKNCIPYAYIEPRIKSNSMNWVWLRLISILYILLKILKNDKWIICFAISQYKVSIYWLVNIIHLFHRKKLKMNSVYSILLFPFSL
jgi:hypothetical protein